eukprot:TRINITY_DN6834_c0_g1_i1.p1 TRINITY_DN6834_c0_g1~~TRINITY_DN6834_c0_g1_i1.p1  ORF type:complete len:378 (-),score=107.92 TRINITY_DN6834_c0_g1_i1:562-1695(-)
MKAFSTMIRAVSNTTQSHRINQFSTVLKQYLNSTINTTTNTITSSSSAARSGFTRAAGGVALASPSLLLFPYDDENEQHQAPLDLISAKSTLSASAPCILSASSLKDSFDAFLQSIEPIITDTRFTLGVSMIPHPAKVAKGGEDAYFVSSDGRCIGVADGVGGWGDIGVDPALYSRSLMEGARLSADNRGNNLHRDPVELMADGYNYSACVQGSSTAVVIVLDGMKLYAANLGDSGLMIIRGQEIIFRSKEQQHSFNFPYQIGTGSADKPEHSVRYVVDIQPNDIVIVGSDGLWDNLYDSDIFEIIASANTTDATALAQAIARHAEMVAVDKDIISPFSKCARSNGYPFASGGKLDDITVLVGRIVLNAVEGNVVMA